MFFTVVKCSAVFLAVSALILVVSLKAVQYYGESYALTFSKQKNQLEQTIHEGVDEDGEPGGRIRCNGSTQCAASPLGAAHCVNGFCECLPGFVSEVYDSVPRCKCPKGTTRYGNFCWRIAGFLGGQCDDDTTCTAPGSFCIQGTCKCHPNLKPWGGRCWDAIELDTASQREHLTLMMCLIIAAGLMLPLIVKSCSNHHRARRAALQNPYSNPMQVRLPSRSSMDGGLTDAERIIAEFAVGSDPGSGEVGSDGMPIRYAAENDKPPTYTDVMALVKSMEAEAMMRHLQSQLQKQQRSRRRASAASSTMGLLPSTSAAEMAPASPTHGACAMPISPPPENREEEDGIEQAAEDMDADASITLKMGKSDTDSTDSSSICDDLPSFTDAMASRRNSMAVFIGHDDFKEYMPPPAYISNPPSSSDSSRSQSADAEE